LVTAPVIPLTDVQALTSALLACGARIDEINTLRRRLDRVKGGGIARATKARVLSLILSDVVGSPLVAIASGPTAPDPTTREDALVVLEKYFSMSLRGVERRINLIAPPNRRLPRRRSAAPRTASLLGNDIRKPLSILQSLISNTETPKPDDPIFSRVQNVIVGENAIAVEAAVKQAEQEGFQAESLGSAWQGEARETGVELAQKLRVTKNKLSHPFCLIAGGETTVSLRVSIRPATSTLRQAQYGARDYSTLGTPGKGGRNQELALAAVSELAGMENVLLISLATDGEDGPTDAAGAVVNGGTLERAQRLGLDAAGHLSGHDAYPFFKRLGDLLQTGPTGTNVNDLVFLLGL
jgi:hydroxypyruvate reductase